MDGRTPRAVVRFAALSATSNNVGFFAAPIFGTLTNDNFKPSYRNQQTGHDDITTHSIAQITVAAISGYRCGRLRSKHDYRLHSVLHL